ncbi:MAG: carbonic anhydrase family protein [Acidimicrobiia bacterium]|nr:carbonic anhydrase family protein [Acidimicrobiia bacterium]
MTEWSYEGATGPDHWADLDPAWAIAKLGIRQSPIDLAGATDEVEGSLGLSYDKVTLTEVANDGHTLQVGVTAGGMLTFGQRTWTLGGLHFHTPSEHHIDGEAFDMEIHLVHTDDRNQLGVLGVFAEIAGGFGALSAVFDAAPDAGTTVDLRLEEIPVVDVLPPDRSRWFAYTGSLTTPPFTEQVQWVVLRQPLEVSESDVQQMRRLFGANARPVQPKHSRRVSSPG